MKHLPGPYELKDGRIEGRNELHGQSTGVVILATLERHRSGSTDHVCPDDIQIATGRLFAAAPDWADSLELIARTADFNKDDGAFDLGKRLIAIEKEAKVALALLD